MLVSFETSVDFHRTTLRYVPEDKTLHNRRCDFLRSYNRSLLRAEVVVTVTMNTAAIWDVTQYSVVDVYRYFRGK
jgi:hypothetical protein